MDHKMHDMKDMDHMDMSNHGDGDSTMDMNMGNMKLRFWISLIIALPIFFLSPMMGINLPFQFEFPGSNYVVLILSTILFFYGGKVFIQGAIYELKAKSPAMMTLVTMGISVSYIYSLYSFVMNNYINPSGHVMDFFWELASLIIIMILGHWIEMNSVMNAGDAVKKMQSLLPNSAKKIDQDGKITEIKITDIQINDQLLVKAGEKIPVDSKLVEGSSSVNESLVTGESRAINKNAGDELIGGSINGDGTLKVEATAKSDEGYLSKVMDLVESAQKDKSSAQSLADQVSKWLFYGALIVGIIALIVWTIISGVSGGMERFVTVLVIACPHALGLAVPMVTAKSTEIAATNGLLIRNRKATESMNQLEYIFMDKTGTLTQGEFKLNRVESLNDKYSNDDILKIAAGIEGDSSHPLATGILNAINQNNLEPMKMDQTSTLKGTGMIGNVANDKYLIVNAKYLDKNNYQYDKELFNEIAGQGNSVSYLLKNQEVIGVLGQGDLLRPESKQMVQKLKSMNIIPVMLTGDNQLTAEKISQQLGGIEYKSNLLPEDKEKIIKEYKENNHKVMMVGDGVNDAPSLSRADIGVAIGAGTDVAISSADAVLVKSNPSDIINLIELSISTNKKMKQNLWWGAGYNLVAIPLAAGILAPIGFILPPSVGAILMSLSTVIVAINAETLHIKKNV
ncbi:copper-translocating P-type ATPase [Lactobacillus sp. S2-2]|uniref:heavy metal translocating P-type ATPase n=1 Tax=Lactobacillus sp. S2-2 TaxID=2692917 RepID=UPI001F25C469|nr:heavy metal translocating P-type ATPase [Lactobacillus sp. S2-2]MCF6514740.1 copper-translocating P-type ATPase [Lactobacillus sp. S2-2]